MTAEGAPSAPSTPGVRPDLPDRIVLVGFMAAGKTTTGRLLAERIGYAFVDLDEEVERTAGRSVAEIFRHEGEEAFRTLEARVTGRLDDRRHVVVAAGGGWMARAELRERWPDAVRFWLRVEPETVLERIGGAVASRPMLDPESPERSVRRLLRRRRSAYARAEHAVRTEGRSVEEVVERIVARLEGSAT